MSESNQFEEIEDIFKYLLKQEFINPDDIDLLAQKFKTTFLTIENKEEFFPFLNRFIQSVEGNDIYTEERVDSLKIEIESFYDRIGTNFSVYHVAGYRDPNDTENSEKFSDEDDNFEFHNKDYLPPVFGPNIPEEKKPLVRKIIEKIASLQDQKQTRRQQVLQRWRQLRLANQIQKLKSQAPALQALHNVCSKANLSFYKIKEYVELLNKQDSEKVEELMANHESEVRALREELAKALQEQLQNGLQMQKDKELEQKISLLQGDLQKRLQDNEKLKGLFESQKKELNDVSKEERMKREQLEKLNLLLQQLEKRKQQQDQEMEKKANSLLQAEQALKLSQGKIDELIRDKEVWKTKCEQKDLKSLQKIRYFIKIMNLFKIRLLAFGFMSIFKRKEKAKISLMNVTQRIKARLLIQTRNIYCGQDIMKSYLKWMLKSRPDFIRESISKIPLTGRINQQVSFWRMKKLVFKPIVKKLSESAKALRRLKGFFLLHKVFKNKEFLDMHYFLQRLNPNHRTLEMVKVERVLQRFCDQRSHEMREALKKLIKNRDIIREILKRLIDKNYNQMRAAFWILRMKNRHTKQMNEMIIIQNLFDRMAANKRAAYKTFVEKFKSQQGGISKLMQKLLESQRAKQNGVFSSLKRHRNECILDDMRNQYVNRFKEMMKQGSVKLLRDNLVSDAKQILNKLRENNREQKRNMLLGDYQNEKLKKFFQNLANKKTLLKNSAMGVLRKNNQNYKDNYQNKRNLLEKIKQRMDLLKRNIFNQLRDNNNRVKGEQEQERIQMNKMFDHLSRAQGEKQKQSMRKMFSNFDLVGKQNQKLKDLLQRRMAKDTALNKKRALNNLIENVKEGRQEDLKQKKCQDLAKMLKNGLNQKLKQCLNQLLYKNKQLQQGGQLKDMIKKNLLQKLIDGQKLSAKSALHALINNKNRAQGKDQREKQVEKRVFRIGNRALLDQMRKALDALRNNKRSFKNKVVDRVLLGMADSNYLCLKKYFDALRAFQRKLKGDQEEKEARKNALLRKILFGSEMKKGLAFNNLRQFKNQQIIKELKDRLNQSRVLARLVMAQNAKKLQQFYRMVVFYKILILENQKNLGQQNKFLNLLLKLNDKKKQAFNSLLRNNKQENERKRELKNILGTLFNNQDTKLRKVWDKLLQNKIKTGADGNINTVITKYEQLKSEKTMTGALAILRRAQEAKQRTALQGLKRNSTDEKKNSSNQMLARTSPLSKLMRKLQEKYRHAFNELRKNKNENKGKENEALKEMKSKMKVLGVGENVMDALVQFVDSLKNIEGKPYKSSPKDRFLNLIEFMENNDPDGKYQQFLDAIARGEIQNVDDLKKIAAKLNTAGKYQPLLKQMVNPHLEMLNMKKWLEMNNGDGRYTHLLAEMGKNPDFNKLDLLNYLDKGNVDGKYDAAKARLNFDTAADDLLSFMRKNNQPGTFTNILDSQLKLRHPKLTSLANYCEMSSDLLPLKEKINEIQARKQLKKLVEFMNRNNGDGRFNDALKHLASKKQPKLSDLASHIKSNPNKPYGELLDRLNMKTPPLTQRVLKYLVDNNADGRFSVLIQKLQERSGIGIADIYKLIADMKGEVAKELMDYLDCPAQVRKYVAFMKNNNTNGNFNEILDQMKWKPNPSLTDLLKAMMKHEKQCDLKELIDSINADFRKEELLDFLHRRNANNQFGPVLKEFATAPNLFEFFKYLSKNKRSFDCESIFEKLDGHEEDFPSPLRYLESKMKEFKNDSNVEQLQRKLNIMRFPSFTNCMETVVKNLKLEELYRKLNQNETPEQIERLNFFFQNNAQNPDYFDVRQMLVLKKPLNELFNYIEENEGKLHLLSPKQILNQDYLKDPLDECLKQILADNQNGKYNDLQDYLKKIPNPTVKDILDFISLKGNPEGKYDDLLNKLNQKDLKDRFIRLLEWIADNNIDNNYDELNQFVDSLENPKLSDILKYASMNNKEGKYNPLLERILGRKLVPKKLLQLLAQQNRKGLYNDLIKFLEENPTATFEQIIDALDKLNKNGEQNKLLAYIFGENDDFSPTGTEFEKILKQFLASGDFPEVEDYMKKNKVKSPFQLLKWLEEHNKDGKYDDLINALKNFIQEKCNPETGVNRMGFPQAFSNKMRECLKRLRSHNKDHNERLLQERNKVKSLFINAQKDMRLAKLLCLNKLKNNMAVVVGKDQDRQEKVKKYISMLINAQNAKKATSNQRLRQNKDKLSEKQKMENEKFAKVLSIAENKYKGKKNQIVETMRSRNNLLKDINASNAKRLRGAFSKKLKDAFEKLRENNKRNNMMNNVKQNLFNKLMSANYKNSLKNCLNALKDNKRKGEQNDEFKKRMQNQLFKYMVRANRTNIKDYFDKLRSNKNKLLGQDENERRVNRQLLKNLDGNYKDALRRILDQLRRNKAQAQMSEAIGSKVKGQLFNSFLKNSNESLRKYFEILRDHRRAVLNQGKQRNSAAQSLMKAFSLGGNGALKKYFDELRRNQMRSQLKEAQRNMAVHKLLEKLKNGLNKKSGHCVAHLMENRREDLGNKLRIKELLEKLFERQNGKSKEVLNKLVKNKNDFANKERTDRDRLKKILEKAHQRNIQRPFYKLIENCLNKQKQEQMLRGKFNDLGSNWKLKQGGTLSNIYRNYLQDLLLDAQKRQILKTMISNHQNKKKQALQSMINNLYSKKNKTNEAVKVVRKNLMQDLWYFYRILKMNKFLKERNQIQEKLNQMVYCLRKNHKHVMRQAVNQWFGTDIKNKLKLGTSMLETIILRREHGAYHSIKKYYLYVKFEKFVQGLMKLITLIDGKIYLEKEYFMNQLLDRNLWYQRVIDIWTIKSLPNHQIAFWKMRYAKDLKQDGVSAEKALKLKKLIHMMNMKCQGVLSNGFWKIHANNAQVDPVKNSTFVQMIAKY